MRAKEVGGAPVVPGGAVPRIVEPDMTAGARQ